MSKREFYKRRIFPVIFMLVITIVFISITSGVYTLTKDRISLNQALKLKRAVLAAGSISPPADPRKAEQLYETRIREVKDASGKVLYYTVMDENGSKPTGYVFISQGPGLWGEITTAVGLSLDLNLVEGLAIVNQVETPGLGGRITEQWFTNQFKKKRTPVVFVPEGTPTAENEFQAVTGATYSTTAIKDIINATVLKAKKLVKEN